MSKRPEMRRYGAVFVPRVRGLFGKYFASRLRGRDKSQKAKTMKEVKL